MSNVWDQIRSALAEARELDRAVQHFAGNMAALIVGRLRYVGADTLRKLKRELRDFDMTTGRWK